MVKVAESSHSNLGKIEIASEVLTVIASIATSEIKGLEGHFKEIKDLSVEKVTKKQLARGIKVDTKDDGIHIDVYCSFSYGINISETAIFSGNLGIIFLWFWSKYPTLVNFFFNCSNFWYKLPMPSICILLT